MAVSFLFSRDIRAKPQALIAFGATLGIIGLLYSISDVYKIFD